MSSVAPPLTGDDTSPGTPDRWYLLSYVATTYFTIYAHRNLINYIQPSLLLPITEGGLGLDESQLSWVGPAWQLPYCFSQLFAGYLSDRFSRRRVILCSLLASSICLAMIGLVGNLHELLIGRALLGFAQACAVPAMAGAIADCFRPRTRSKAMAIYLFSYNAAVIVAGKYGGAIADLPARHIPGTPETWVLHGWRLSHFVFAAVGVVAWLFLLKVLREPLRTERREDRGLGTEGGTVWQTLGQIIRVPSFHLMSLTFACAGIVVRISRFWMPQHFHNVFHDSLGWNQEDVGSFSTLWIQIGSMTGLLLGGLLADRLVPQADAEDRQVRRRLGNHVQANPGPVRVTGSRRQYDPGRIEGEGFFGGHHIIADAAGLRAEFLEIVDQVESEAVIIVDDQKHAGSPARKPRGIKVSRQSRHCLTCS